MEPKIKKQDFIHAYAKLHSGKTGETLQSNAMRLFEWLLQNGHIIEETCEEVKTKLEEDKIKALEKFVKEQINDLANLKKRKDLTVNGGGQLLAYLSIAEKMGWKLSMEKGICPKGLQKNQEFLMGLHRSGTQNFGVSEVQENYIFVRR